MKKLISFLLVIMMLCSMSTVAFAAGVDTQIGVGSESTNITTDDGTANTELWLQVEANGQIDVTVPLTIVFKTNIDGGAAQEPTNYKITNNNNARLLVTGIEITDHADTDMALVDYENGALTIDDQYKVKMVADLKNEDKADAADFSYDLFDVKADATKAADAKVYTKAAADHGVFALNRDKSRAAATDTVIGVTMNTSPLSFVTKIDDSTDYGLKLLTITYTVAIDTSTVKGEAEIEDYPALADFVDGEDNTWDSTDGWTLADLSDNTNP